MKQQLLSNVNLPQKCTLIAPTVAQLVVKIPQKRSAKIIAGAGKNKKNLYKKTKIS